MYKNISCLLDVYEKNYDNNNNNNSVISVRGASSVAAYYTVFVYQAELAPPRFRLFSTSTMVLAGSGSYILIDIVAAYFTKGWRFLHMYTALPGLLSLMVILKIF